MKNKWFLVSMLSVLAVTSLAGCNKDNKKQEDITDEMITNIIEASNPDVEVNIGEYESMINPVTPSEEDYTTFTSSSVLDAPRDYVVTVTYASEEETTLQNVTNLMSNVVSANDKASIITITDRGGEVSSNGLLTLANEGKSFTVSRPGGYEYGEVYEIEINDAPYLAFENKSNTIRKLTIEIEDDPNEAATYDEKVLKEGIVNIDLDKVSNKQMDEETSTYSFDYDGDLDLAEGQIFYATRDVANKYLDFYGVYQSKKDLGNKKRITYLAPDMDQIYRAFHLKGEKPLNLEECDTDILLTQDIATQQFKNSTITRALAKTALPYAHNDLETVKGMLSNFKVHFDTSYVNNRVGFKMCAGIYGYKLADQCYLTFEVGYEKVTDYNVDFDVKIRWKWIFPVGVDYKIKCLEESDSAYYVKINVTKSFIPDTPTGPDETADKKFFDELTDAIENIGEGIEAYDGSNFDPSTSGTRTSWPILRVDCYYFAPATFRLQLEVYIDIGIQATGLFKKQVHNTKVDFCYTNIDSAKTDEQSKTAETSNWMIGFIGSVHLEVGLKVSFSFSILGLYDYLCAQAYAEAFINCSVTGMAIANITSQDGDKTFTGYICIDFAITAGVRVGIYFKILFIDKNISKLLYYEYVFRIKYENALEHWSKLSENEVTIDQGQTLSLDQTNVLWIEYFDSVTMQLREKKFGAKDEYEIFSGSLVKDKNWGKGRIFSYKSSNENYLTVDKDGVMHVKDGTPNEFTVEVSIEVSNWAGTLSDKTITVHFIASDTKELYVGDQLIGDYRPGYQVTLPEGPKEYGKLFLYYSYNGTHYNVGDKFTMLSDTTTLTPIYRLLKYFDVNFYDGLGNCVSYNRIMEFEAAEAPVERIRDRFMRMNGDYVFLGWDCDFSYITNTLNVHGIYMEVK